jgi:hypothetical protein
MNNILTLLLLIGLVPFTWAQNDIEKTGSVALPLNTYNTLINASKLPKDIAPAAYAIGKSNITASIIETDERTTAHINVQTSIEIFENKWTSVPILPYGAGIISASINEDPISLVQDSQWLSWSTKKAGKYWLKIAYTVDAQHSELGYVVPLPIPKAAATSLNINFPAAKVDMAVIPSSNLKFNSQSQTTTATANIPSTSSVLISWRVASKQAYVMSRALYQGELKEGAVRFSTNFDVKLFTGESINIPLMPNSIILNEVKIDDKPATIIEKNGFFTTVVQGRGTHTITVVFQAQVIQQQGPPSISFPILEVPISQFQLSIAGKKDVSVISNNSLGTQNKVHVENKIIKDNTLATVYLPMAEVVQFSWVDAIPKDIQVKLRANANVYHAISAEEGVLYGQALIDYEITHGETSTLSFTLPSSVQVNQITSDTGGISDWNVNVKEQIKTVTVFLDRSIKANYQLHVLYEQLLKKSADKTPVAIKVPLIKAKNMHRQRGIVALLAGTELSLKPIEETEVTRVGENQLPAFFRNQITATIAHTFKYTSESPQLTVNTIAPIRKQGKYDAQVDTLISLGEVSMRASTGISLEVKSGAIVDLQLQLPKDINVLNVTGPSIRNQKITNDGNVQNITVEFTQEMTGQFSIEVNYEKILNEKNSGVNNSELVVPTLSVLGTEVQHGRIAIEALTALEVKTAQSQQLSTLDINELPQQLVLKTTNPILLAFKYVNTETPHVLKLSMTRHQELDVQVAAIESAYYQTLITNDGLSITTATFNVRNSRRQFLRLNLPENSEVWSVFVDGKAEKPAMASSTGSSAILIKMLNSVSGFPVVVVYATSIDKIGLYGSIKSQLPIPDMVVTHSHWDVYLPIGPNYQKIVSNMDIMTAGKIVNPRIKTNTMNTQMYTNSQASKPLQMSVPKQGIQYSFEKLYANKSDTPAGFKIAYSSNKGNQMGVLLSILSVIMIWMGIFAMQSGKISQYLVMILLVSGTIGLFLTLGYLNSNRTLPMVVALIFGTIFMALKIYQVLKKRRVTDV